MTYTFTARAKNITKGKAKSMEDMIERVFLRVADECFYANPTVDTNNYSGQLYTRTPPLVDACFKLEHFWSAVNETYKAATSEYPKSALRTMFVTESESMYDLDEVIAREEYGSYYYDFHNVEDCIVQTIISGALYYSHLKSQYKLLLQKEGKISIDEAFPSYQAEDVLYEFLRDFSGINEDEFDESHFAMKIEQSRLDTSIKILNCHYQALQAKKSNNESATEQENSSDTNEESPINSTTYEKLQQTIENLRKQIEEKDARVADLNEALNPTQILEDHEEDVFNVFNRTYKVAGQEVATHPRVQKIARKNIDVNDAPQVAVFMKACYDVECAILGKREIAQALIGLKLKEPMEDKDIESFNENVSKKLVRLRKSMKETDKVLYEKIYNKLKYPDD